MKHQWIWLLGLVLIAALGVSCGASERGGGSEAARATVRGTVLDSVDEPVSGATVQCQGALTQALTADDGAFELEVSVGAHKLTITKDDVLLAERCLSLAERVTYDLGTITPSSPTNCDTVCTNGADSADPDCDGLPSDVETAGWDATITLGDGNTETRHATSDPGAKDTDGDGLSDGEEFAARTDPRRTDTDGDLLSDYAELKVYKSNPLTADTDGDSRGPNGDKASDPNLWDGFELAVSHTSPVLADTDGDGMTDYEEIHSGGTNPLVADLPVLALELYGDPHIELTTDSTGVCTKTTTNLVREAQERVSTDSVSTKMSIENTVKLHTETKAGTGTWPPSFNAELTTDTEFKHGYIHETSTNFTQTSVQDAQTLASCREENNVSFANGKISVAMKLRNQSGLSFKVKGLRVIAYQVTTGSNFRLIGTLEPDPWPVDGYVLGPYSDITMTVWKRDVDAEVMKALVSNPSALMFEVGGYELFQLDEWGVNATVNYAKLGEAVVQRTGLLTIDFGDGTIERHMIATNVNRNPDGSARGITLKEALATVLRTSYSTEAQRDGAGKVIGKKVLEKLRTTATYQNDPARTGRGFWIVGGSGEDFAGGIDANFDDIVLNSGQRISLVFLKDTDLDGLFDSEERLLGSNPTVQDTDGDGMTDYDEAKVGWDVNVNGASYHVYSNPRFSDVDGDYLSDSAEKVIGSDPYRKNTDGDGLNDTNDPYPLSAPCLNGSLLGIAAWWDGTMASATTVSDTAHTAGTGDPLGYASDGVLSGTARQITWKPDYITTAGLNGVFGFNPLPTEKDQQLTVEDDAMRDPRRSISPQAQFTLAGWIYWDGVAIGAAWATIFTKGAPGTETYGLYVRSDGVLALALYRNYQEKCWADFWGDSACADSTHDRREWLETPSYRLPLQTWVHVTATFGNETMRIYANGVRVAEAVMNYVWDGGGACWCRNDTNHLIINGAPLRIGLDLAPASAQWSYRGMMDELQVFGRQMSPTEVELFHQIGVCRP